MRSSESTRSPPTERGIRLLLLLAGEDHPKACTGRRLLRRGAARAVDRVVQGARRPVVLDPHADRPLATDDEEAAVAGGLLAIDCSWNRVAARGRLPDGSPGVGGIRRRLPLLIAGNPQHYGRVNELNTVEALAAGVYLLGRTAQAEALLQGFRGGGGFLDINRDRLDRYRRAANADEIRALERSLFGGARPPDEPVR